MLRSTILWTVLATAAFTATAHAQIRVGEIDISECGRGVHMLLGDVTGDGRVDLVTMQAINMDDDRFIGRQVNCLTAYELTGEMIWQVGDPSVGEGAGADIPAQIYDIDGDGFNEVISCMQNDLVDGKFAILNGKTGDVKETREYPGENAHDTIIIANLTGSTRPENIILKDRYRNQWAMNKDWSLKFRYRGNIGHYPLPADFDNDGREELLAGFTLVDENGDEQWSAENTGHADTIWTGDLDQDPSNGREIAIGGDDVTVYSADGELLWRVDEIVEPQYLAMGDFLPDSPGFEVVGHDRIDRGRPGRQGTFLITSTGEMKWYVKRTNWLGLTQLVYNWDGEGHDYIALWNLGRGIQPVLLNGEGEEVASFDNGYLAIGDLDGDGSHEVISFDRRRARIYSHKPIDLASLVTGTPRQQNKVGYNYTRYHCGEYPPPEAVAAP